MNVFFTKVFRWFQFKFIPTALILQMTLGSAALLAVDSKKPKSDEEILIETIEKDPESLFEVAAEEGSKNPDVQKKQAEFKEAFEGFVKGDVQNLRLRKYANFHLDRQRLEIINADGTVHNYDLSHLNLKLPSIVYTSLKTKIEAYQYERLIARHIIDDVDLAAFLGDRELLMLVDQIGNLHAIDMGYLAREVFKSPIPIIGYLWEPAQKLDLSHAKVSARFQTVGAKPFNETELAALKNSGAVIPTSEKGDLLFSAGDLYVTFKSDGKEIPLGLFARRVTYDKIYDGMVEFLKEVYFVSPESVPPKYAVKLLASINAGEENKDASAMTPEVRNAFLAIQPEQVASALKRTLGVDKTLLEDGTKSEITGIKNRNFDTFTLDQWQAQWKTLSATAVAKRNDLLSGIDASDLVNLAESLDPKTKESFTELNRQIECGDFSASWKELVGYQKPEKLSPHQQRMKALREFVSGEGARQLGRTLTLVGVIAGAWGLYGFADYAIHNSGELSAQNLVRFMNWFHDNYVPAAVKDFDYRWPLAKSITSMMGLIPAVMLSGAMVGPGLKATSVVFQKLAQALELIAQKKGSTTLGSKAKELAEKARYYARSFVDSAQLWNGLGIWQRVVTAGNRIWAVLMYPCFNWIVGTVLRNPTTLPALKNFVNPLKRYSPDSAVGQAAKLTAPVFAGITNPFASSSKHTETVEAQKRVQNVIALQQKRAESMAWLLATLEVSGRTDIDPATLLMVGQGLIKVEELSEIFTDPVKKNLWERTREEIYQTLLRVDNKGIFEEDLSKINPADFVDYYKTSNEAAERIRSQGTVEAALTSLRGKFARTSKKAVRSVINFGQDDFAKLNTLYANEYVSQQVRQEFIFDHFLVVLYPSLFGERADPSDLKNRVADPDASLWTAGQFKTEVIQNTQAHLTASGSEMVLVYQGHPQIKETNYEPREGLMHPFAGKAERLGEGFLNWFASVGLTLNKKEFIDNLKKSDLGTYAVRKMLKRLVVIQAAVTMAVGFRLAFTDQGVEQALRGYWLGLSAGLWAYSWPWLVLRQGNMLEGSRIEKNKSKLDAIRKGILEGLDGRGSEDALNESYEELFKLYGRRSFGKKTLAHVKEFKKALEALPQLKEKGLKAFFGERAAEFYGLVAKLHLALAETDSARRAVQIEETSKNILKAYEGSIDPTELRRLNASGLLEFALKYPPIATEANPWVSETTTFYMGALLTTALYIPLGIKTFTKEALETPNLLMWTAINFIGHGGLYALLSSEGISTIQNSYKKAKEQLSKVYDRCEALLRK